ncbi:hypothetical protein BD410DRAFT_785977 [Rickenella mellea]|uniref:Arrestin C-terminal-like domain-containing protein n=1 Tax=Rickenella mellea TaxID=50990 RepID=A0A4Y7QAU3_9AGAM|nr:hypothetical protein BD410DRAFT_785977 [Rickenella mellea]
MKDKPQQSHLDICLASDPVVLRGPGVDVDPTLLWGNVVLFLTESTSVKEISLQFRGKARLPPSYVEEGGIREYIICQHEWSFLRGAKQHGHTLKPGRHVFPFHLNAGGSLPSSINPRTSDGASVSYKLSAVAVRPGITSNLNATCPVWLMRSLSSDALEYQQSLEIENTWPERLMYSLVLPHKAWAVGDNLTTVMKFVPMAKGIQVLHITTSINETKKTFGQGERIEHTSTLSKFYHDIIGGVAVACDATRIRELQTPRSEWVPFPFPNFWSQFHRLRRADAVVHNTVSNSANSGSTQAPLSESNEAPADDTTCSEISTRIVVPLPTNLTPTHTLDPIIISHRICWTILVGNPDGRISRIRGSQPLHILDMAFLHEARRSTAVTRRRLLGAAAPSDTEEEIDLPSYSSHIRDRVANGFISELPLVRVTNPWVHQKIDPLSGAVSVLSPAAHTPGLGSSTPALRTRHVPSESEGTTPLSLEWLDFELALSLCDRIPVRQSKEQHGVPVRPESDSSWWHIQRTSHLSGDGSECSPRGEMPTYIHAQDQTPTQQHELFTISMKPHSSLHPFSRSHFSRAHSDTNTHHHSKAGHRTSGVDGESPRPAVLANPCTTDVTALLFRAFTKVPTYDVASRGFQGGGPPPLETMRELPSYEGSPLQR